MHPIDCKSVRCCYILADFGHIRTFLGTRFADAFQHIPTAQSLNSRANNDLILNFSQYYCLNVHQTCSLLTSDHTNVLFSCQKSSATADSSLLINGWYLLVTISNCRMAARFASKSSGSGPIARP